MMGCCGLLPGQRERLLFQGERILHSYSAGFSIHLIKEGPQNRKAFGDSKHVFTTHKPYKCFLRLFTIDPSALKKHYLTIKVSQSTSSFPVAFSGSLCFLYLVPPPPICFLMSPVPLLEDVCGNRTFLPKCAQVGLTGPFIAPSEPIQSSIMAQDLLPPFHLLDCWTCSDQV